MDDWTYKIQQQQRNNKLIWQLFPGQPWWAGIPDQTRTHITHCRCFPRYYFPLHLLL